MADDGGSYVPANLKMTVGETFWELDECPKGGCSTQSFKNAQVWGYTADECLDKLRKHYTNSSLHWPHFEKEPKGHVICRQRVDEAVEEARSQCLEDTVTEEMIEHQ